MIQFHCVITLFLISTDMCLRTNVPFQYTISGNREQVFLLYYKDFFEQICSDVQFISPPEEVGEFLLHLLKSLVIPSRKRSAAVPPWPTTPFLIPKVPLSTAGRAHRCINNCQNGHPLLQWHQCSESCFCRSRSTHMIRPQRININK